MTSATPMRRRQRRSLNNGLQSYMELTSGGIPADEFAITLRTLERVANRLAGLPPPSAKSSKSSGSRS